MLVSGKKKTSKHPKVYVFSLKSTFDAKQCRCYQLRLYLTAITYHLFCVVFSLSFPLLVKVVTLSTCLVDMSVLVTTV